MPPYYITQQIKKYWVSFIAPSTRKIETKTYETSKPSHFHIPPQFLDFNLNNEVMERGRGVCGGGF
jgi:hypothetical protein